MPYTIRFDPDSGYIHVTLTGTVNLAEAELALHETVELARDHPDAPLLADAREAEYDLSATEVYRMASEVGLTDLVRRRLALVSRPRGDFDRGALFQELSRHRGMVVQRFATPDEARAWLGS